MLEFDVSVASQGIAPVLRVRGEIDVYTCTKLHDQFNALIADGKTDLILDLTSVSYIDSTGLGTIAHAARSVEPQSGRVHVVSTNPQVSKLFDVSGLSRKNVTLFTDEAEASDFGGNES